MTLEEFEKKADAFMEKRGKATNARVETSDNLKEFEEKAQRFMAKRSQPKVTENITSKEKSEQNENKISSLEKSKLNLNIDKLWVDKTSNKPTATSQLGTSLVQQVKNGTTQRQNKSNVLGKAANNIVKTITEKVPVTSKYVQAYQNARDMAVKKAENKSEGYKPVDISNFVAEIKSGNSKVSNSSKPKYIFTNANMPEALQARAESINKSVMGYKTETEELKSKKKNIDKEIKKAQSTLNALNGSSWDLNVKRNGLETMKQVKEKLSNDIDSLQKQSDELQTRINKNNIDYEYDGTTYGDTFGGKFAANYSVGKLNEQANKAWSDYISNPTQVNKEYAQNLSDKIAQFTETNKDTLSKDGLISKSLANYVPQFINQQKAGISGGVAGGLAGGAAAAAVPAIAGQMGPQVAIPEEIATIPAAFTFGATKGGKAGYVAGIGKYSYENMQGAAFKNLLDLGVDEQTAIKAASDEALISSMIEMADTGIDIATLGMGKLIDLVGKNGVKAVAKGLAKEGAENAAESTIKKALKSLGKYGLNIGQEALEESTQEIISIANEDRFKNGENNTGKLDLAGKAVKTAFNLTDEEKSRVKEAGTEGAKIAALMGGIEIAGAGLGNTLATRNIKNNNQIGNAVNINISENNKNNAISNRTPTQQNIQSAETVQKDAEVVQSKNENQQPVNEIDYRLKLFDELVEKGYAEYKVVDKETVMLKTDKWNSEADDIAKKIKESQIKQYYPQNKENLNDGARLQLSRTTNKASENSINPNESSVNTEYSLDSRNDTDILKKVEPLEKTVENVQAMKYNKIGGAENDKIQFRGMLEGNNEPPRIYEKNKPPQTQAYTKSEYERFEKSITPIAENRITGEERALTQKYKNKYNKNIVLFDANGNSGFGGGASLTDRNKIYININVAKEFGYNMIASHEVMESDILHNKELKSDIIDNIIQAIISDPNFEQQKIEFWEAQEGNPPSDYLIAKDIICDRFAEIDNNENLSYKNVLSQETNMTLDFGIDNFRKAIKNNIADTESAFSLPKNNLETQAEKVSKLPTKKSIENVQTMKQITASDINNRLKETSIKADDKYLNKYTNTSEILNNGSNKINYEIKDVNVTKGNISRDEAKTIAKNAYFDNNVGPAYNNGEKILVSKSDISESIAKIYSNSQQSELIHEHLLVMKHLNEIISKAEKISQSSEKKSDNQVTHQHNILWTYYLDGIKINGEDYKVVFDVVSRDDGENHYRLQRLEKINKEGSPHETASKEAAPQVRREPSITNSITPNRSSVNTDYAQTSKTDTADTESAFSLPKNNLETQAEKVSKLPTKKSIENVQAMKYNKVESESGINDKSKDIKGNDRTRRNGDVKESIQGKRKYTWKEYNDWEQRIKPTAENELTNSEKQSINNAKLEYNKEVRLYDENNNDNTYSGGASRIVPGQLNISRQQAKEFGLNYMIGHENVESDIMFNDIANDILDPAIDFIMSDAQFQKQVIEFWKGQVDEIPKGDLIAKDILCDRFAERISQTSSKYKNVLSENTRNIIDMALDNYYKQVYGKELQSFGYNLEDSNKSSFSLSAIDNSNQTKNADNTKPTSSGDIRHFKSSENGRPYMDLNEEISTDSKSKYAKTGLSDIEEKINEIVPVRYGKFRQKAYGIYKTKGEIIRIKQKNDIPVALHELTHHLDKQFGLSAKGVYDNELFPIAVANKNASKSVLRAEGVAEFGRYYITEPTYAEQVAPEYYKAFREELSKHPRMEARVNELQEMMSNYLKQSPLNRVLSHIDNGDDTANLFTKVKERALEFKKGFRKNFTDDLDPLKQVINDITDNKKLPVDKDAYIRARLNRGVTGKVRVALEYGIVNNQGKKVGKSLKEIIEPVSKNFDEFIAYISALRAKDLQSRNEEVETGFNTRDVDEIISLYGGNETFNKASEELYKFQNQIMQKTLVNSGIITSESLEAYNKANPHYVPFYRVMDENYKQSKDSLSKSPKRIKGSTRDIINPLESIVKNTYSYFVIAEKNNTYKSLFDLANKYDGTGKWFDRVPTDMIGEKITAQDVKDILDKLDVNKEDADYNELFTTLFRPANYQKGNIITVMDKGKPVHYEIMDKGLFDVLSPKKGYKENWATKILSSGSTALRIGATHTPEFVLRNPIKDTFDAFTYSKNGFWPVADTVIGICNVVGKTDLYYKWLESGGSGSSYTNAQRTTLRNTLEGITSNLDNKSLPQKIAKAVKETASHPLKTYLNLIGEISNITEEGTRVGEFRKALQKGKSLKQAALESRDITVDFSRGGEQVKAANKYIAFLNANVQGLDKMFTAFKERPVVTTIKGIAGFMLPAMVIAAMQDEDDRDKIPQWEKDSHWIFFVGNTPVRIPKSQGVGRAFANLGESIIDFIRKEEPEIFAHFITELLQSYNPTSDIASVLPDTFQPAFENATNYSFFREQKIVKSSLENRSPKYQYDEYSSTIAKKIGAVLNVSPKKVDNLISGYFGNLGKDVANLLGVPFDIIEGKKNGYESTNSKLKKIPLVKGFIASDYASPKLDEFYEEKSKISTEYSDAKFKYEDKKLTYVQKKELDYLKSVNSLYNKAYNEMGEIDDKIDDIEKGIGGNKYKEARIEKLKEEKDKIAENTKKEADKLKARNKLFTQADKRAKLPIWNK